MICQRCGSPAPGSRCLKCGSTSLVSQAVADRTDKRGKASRDPRGNAQQDAPKSRPTGQPRPTQPTEKKPSEQRKKAVDQEQRDQPAKDKMPPRRHVDFHSLSTADKIKEIQSQIGRANNDIKTQQGRLDHALIEARQNVTYAQSSIRSLMDHDLMNIEKQRSEQKRALSQRRSALDDAAQRELKARRAEAITTAKRTAKTLLTSSRALRTQHPKLLSDRWSPEDLVPTAQVRRIASTGTLTFSNLSKLHRDYPQIPALIPFMDQGHVVIESATDSLGDSDPQFAALIRSLVAQAYASVPPGQLVVSVFNPRSNRILAPFSATGAPTAGLFRNIAPTRRAFEEELESHVELMGKAQASIGTYNSMGQLVEATGQHEHQYRLLVVLDGPNDWSREAYGNLEKLMQAGGQAGISVVIHRDSQTKSDDRIDAVQLDKYASTIAHAGKTWRLKPHVPTRTRNQSVTFRPDVINERDEKVSISQLMTLVVKAAEKGSLPNIRFEDLISTNQPATSDKGLQIKMGKTGTKTTEFVLGDTISNIQNVLVGGRAGSGKTNLLKVMIYSMAARYQREELELFLLDFKEGGDFMPFAGGVDGTGQKVPPLRNAAVISRDCDAEFGIATLEHFMDEMKRRSKLTSSNGVSNIWDLRENTGIVLPRWVMVVDEFQGLFTGAKYRQATELLEELVRKGRSFGLHIILATQTLSGVQFAGDKANAIFENVAGRVVLQLGPGEFKKFMSSDNDEGDQLRYRGQAIFNPQGGLKSENQHFVVAFAADEYTTRLQRELATNAKTEAPAPMIYRGNERVTLKTLLGQEGKPVGVDEARPLWYGRDSSITARVSAAYLTPVAGSNALLLGGDADSVPAAIATLQTMVLSAVAAENDDLDVLVLEELIPQFRRGAQVDLWLDTVAAVGGTVKKYSDATLAEFWAAVQDAGERRKNTLVVLLGAENTDLQEHVKEDRSWDKLIRNLPRRNVNTIGYWTDERDVPGSQHDLNSDYKTLLFFGQDQHIVTRVSKVNKHDLPELHSNRTAVYSADASQVGLTTVASLEPLTQQDLQEFQKVAKGPGGSLEIVGSADAASGPDAETESQSDDADRVTSQRTVRQERPRPNVSKPKAFRWRDGARKKRRQSQLPPTAIEDLNADRISTANGISAVLGRAKEGLSRCTFGDRSGHLLVAGDPGSEFSALVVGLVYSMAVQHSAQELSIDIMDALTDDKITDLAEDPIPHLGKVIPGDNSAGLTTILQQYLEEAERRRTLFDDLSAISYQEYRGSGPSDLARWLLVVNGASDLAGDEQLELLDKLAAIGPNVGLHLLLTIIPDDQTKHLRQAIPAFMEDTERVFTSIRTRVDSFEGAQSAAKLIPGIEALYVNTSDTSETVEEFSIPNFEKIQYMGLRQLLRTA